MPNVRLCQIDGSIMLAVPNTIVELLQLRTGTYVNLAVEGDRLVIQPTHRPLCTLEELLAQCDPAAPLSDEEKDWCALPPQGEELI